MSVEQHNLNGIPKEVNRFLAALRIFTINPQEVARGQWSATS